MRGIALAILVVGYSIERALTKDESPSTDKTMGIVLVATLVCIVFGV